MREPSLSLDGDAKLLAEVAQQCRRLENTLPGLPAILLQHMAQIAFSHLRIREYLQVDEVLERYSRGSQLCSETQQH